MAKLKIRDLEQLVEVKEHELAEIMGGSILASVTYKAGYKAVCPGDVCLTPTWGSPVAVDYSIKSIKKRPVYKTSDSD